MAELSRSRRHGRDVVSLVMGLQLMAVAALFLVHDLNDGVDLRWVAPIALIVVGVVGLAASARRR